ncbi:hypothetical protein AGDE_15117 [Angomonas deanei]|nr:hypothetical protein AGDE_15117 [Angomonas deanei]|eukprot:EPY19666.1 hypothetical protein AGDE_15117 [Angomonas deanei]
MHLYDHKIHLQRAKTLTIEWMFSFSLLDIYNNYKDKDHAHSLRYFIDMDDSVHDYFNKALVQAENAKFLSALPSVQCGGATPPLFAAKQHILRFRHVNAPSFRSLLSGGLFRKPDLYEFSTDSTKRENQFHRINYHSECLLFCSDLAEYSLFVENRIPRILMNPNVKFTYTPVFNERAHYLETHKREGLYYYYRAFMESEFLFDLMTLFYEVKSSLRFMEYMDKSMPAISGAGFNEVRQVFSPYHPHPESRRREGNFYYRYRVNTVSFIQMADGLMAEYFLDKEFWIYEVLLSRLIGIPLILVVFYYIWSDISYHIKLKLRETNPRRRKYLFYLPFGSTASQVYTINHDPAHPAGRDSPLWRDRFRTLLPQERLWYRVVIKGVEPFIFRVVLLHVKVRFYYNRWKKRLCKTLGRNGTDGRSV